VLHLVGSNKAWVGTSTIVEILEEFNLIVNGRGETVVKQSMSE
jgi:hypothetical protein